MRIDLVSWRVQTPRALICKWTTQENGKTVVYPHEPSPMLLAPAAPCHLHLAAGAA